MTEEYDLEKDTLEKLRASREFRDKFIKIESGPITYKGFWRGPSAIKDKMEAEGRAVRCIDCLERKKCSHVRVNKFDLKPCKDFKVDLLKQSNLMDKKRKEKKS